MSKKKVKSVESREEKLSLDRLVPNAGGSIFVLTRLAMLRALEIDAGSPPLVDHDPLDKPTTIALKEIAEGKIIPGNTPLETESKTTATPEDDKPNPKIEQVPA